MKVQRYPIYHLPHVFHVSRIFEFKEVNVVGEKKLVIQATGFKIGENTLRQMSFVSLENTFVHKDTQQDDDDEDAHMVEHVNVLDPSEVDPSHILHHPPSSLKNILPI
ncbi:hypothetical protein LR48_Vigan02g127800 [Vigna angularis]|uniref:Uncharacterized protein n=1 Tax=Phaseolus angularis TaxID=3914 RepID=A0A0L9TX12_PHAAN|nr:hypothetical protein LR48_Vigan02g127800 [Vigna angularis]